MHYFISNKIPKFTAEISENKWNKWDRLYCHMNLLGCYGINIGKNIQIINPNFSTFGLLTYARVCMPDKLIKYYLSGKNLYVSGCSGGYMNHFDIEIISSNKSAFDYIQNVYNLNLWNLNGKNYLSIIVDIENVPIWSVLEKLIYKIEIETNSEIAIRGKPTYLENKIIDGQKYSQIRYDNNLIQLDRDLLSDDVFEAFMYRKKNKISSILEITKNIPDDYDIISFANWCRINSTPFCRIVLRGNNKTINNTQDPLPELDLENIEPWPLLGATSDGALAESENQKALMDLLSASPKGSAEERRDAVPSNVSAIETCTIKPTNTIKGFIVSPDPKLSQQLAVLYKHGTNNTAKFCYSMILQGKKKPELRKRYLTEEKFIYYSTAIINSCLFANNNDNCVSITFIKQNFFKIQNNIKWTNDDFYYIQQILLDLEIIYCVSTSYMVGSYGKKYNFQNGILSRLCSEGIKYKFPIIRD